VIPAPPVIVPAARPIPAVHVSACHEAKSMPRIQPLPAEVFKRKFPHVKQISLRLRCMNESEKFDVAAAFKKIKFVLLFSVALICC